MKENEKIDALIRHIDHVRDNCILLGERLLSRNIPLGRILIANGFIHDNSKFYGIEWEYLTDVSDNKELMRAAIKQHNQTNQHHPEYWGTIDQMPAVYTAEMICDWAARASEFGTSLQTWISEGAATKFGYTKDSEVYQRLVYYSGLLCDKPFNAV